MIAQRTPAQQYCLIFGPTLLLIGILGFIADATFGSGGDVQGGDLIIFEVNGWHNIVHILSGAIGLSMWMYAGTARAFALSFGGVYLVVAIWGFVTGDSVLGLIPVDLPDNLLHLAIALTGLGAAFASPSIADDATGDPRASRAR